MGPNDAEAVRVFTRESGATIADVTFPVNADFEILVDAEAGNTIWGGGTEYHTGLVLRDISANDDIPVNPVAYGPEAMGAGGSWDPQATQFLYEVKAADLAGRENHCCQAIAFLRVRKVDPDASFAESPMFMLTPP